VVLALVLGPSLETNFRRALVESRSDPAVFVTQPISLLFLVLAAASILAPLRTYLRAKSHHENSPRQ
jgi:putative tricarboxylic transport membrane protein